MLTHPSKRFVRVQIHVTGTFTVPLLHRSRSGIHGYTFRMILLAPLISAFIRMPFLLVTRKPPVIQVVLKSLSYKKSNKKKKTSDIM